MVPEGGVEPPPSCEDEILNLARLPVSPLRRGPRGGYIVTSVPADYSMGGNPVNVIRKPPPDQISPAPRLPDYETARREFSAESIDAELGLRADGPCNLGALAGQRQIALGRGDASALRWFGRGDERKHLTYAELAAHSGKFANMLKNFGVHKGDAVLFLTGTVPEIFWGMVGTALYGAVGGILNPRGNSDYYHHILSHSKAKLLVPE